MAEEDNFDIDIYGDGGEDYHEEGQVQDQTQAQEAGNDTSMREGSGQAQENAEQEDSSDVPDTSLPKPPIVHNTAAGAKRKDGPDDRPVEPGATNALFVGELSWWTTDDDVRSWAKEADCEDELKELTFNEQKVNGKSKGQVFLLFDNPQAATAAKIKIDGLGDSPKYRTKVTVQYTNPLQNPFKTLPKDGPMRNQNRNTSGNFNQTGHQGNFNPNYRGRGRGNFNNNGGGFNNRGGGFQGGMGGGGFQSNPMGGGGFQGGMSGGMNNFNGGGGGGGSGSYGGRGGMMGGRGGMGMRGGRGGMQPGMMGGGMPMGGGMMPNMGMPMMNPMQGGGFQGGYNPGFGGYPQGGPGADQGWTGGPNKRQRQD